MVKAGQPANRTCCPRCQPIRAAIRWLTSTWPRAVGQRPLIRNWAHTPLRQTSGTAVLYCGKGIVVSTAYTGAANSPCPARRPRL